MKTFGKQTTRQQYRELIEVSFQATPEEIRTLAEFLLSVASTMDTCGDNFGHSHLRDWLTGWDKNWPDIIVAR